MSTATDREITIVIDESQNARSFEKEGNFFEKELTQAEAFISRHIEKKNKEKDEKGRKIDNQDYFHQHNTIAILGPRGGGKTTFLLSLRDAIKKDEKKIIWLPNLDPTLIEENDTFLIIVVANILKEIKKRLSGDLNQKIREKLEVLSRDFAVLAPRQVQEEQWKSLVGDPTNFAYELLNQAHSGLSLAHSFHEFLKHVWKR